ncbi:MAG: hypothetical protein M1816_002999 [Peltula sp. TS41687]|nr:MAG: hypothetical protein M1816_002999 [Peltula sp. TS41687]
MKKTQSHQVIALISGGKDSLFSILHCLANGHQVIALANLYPSEQASLSADDEDRSHERLRPDDTDSYMYQTIGHAVIPLYEEALGIPLYRQEIQGSAIDTAKSYQALNGQERGDVSHDDETESLVPLLRRIVANHPEADAVSTGAILSDYQRTRVEAVATRLGLVPLAYLWQYPSLPPGTETSLLADMRRVGQDARIIKCASGGLDAGFLWGNVACEQVVDRLTRAMGRFGALDRGALLGEGGEYETLAVDGPALLWKRRIVVGQDERVVLQNGGGAVSLRIKGAHLASKGMVTDGPDEDVFTRLRIPYLLDAGFEKILCSLRDLDVRSKDDNETEPFGPTFKPTESMQPCWQSSRGEMTWFIWNMVSPEAGSSPESQVSDIICRLKQLLYTEGVSADNICFTTVYLRSMESFPVINKVYAPLFSKPNPPSRVTVGLGDTLPQGVQVKMSVIVWLGPRGMREGLHVQSKSYWAPANIGPYSQAISIPAAAVKLTDDAPHAADIVHVAGQIPLVPASMSVVQDDTEDDAAASNHLPTFRLQTVLSLQHLWRIGMATRVNWWASGVAFVAGDTALETKARIAWEAWKRCSSPDEDPSSSSQEDAQEDDDDSFDIWNERMRHAQAVISKPEARHQLPNHGMIDDVSPAGSMLESAFLMIQVDELPRGCEIEWAGVGIAKARVALSGWRDEIVSVQECLPAGTGMGLCHATIAHELGDEDVALQLDRIIHVDSQSPEISLQAKYQSLLVTVYTDRNLAVENSPNVNLVRCKSVWGPGGHRIAAGVVTTVEVKRNT